MEGKVKPVVVVVELWNEQAKKHNFRRCLVLSKTRARKLKQRLSEKEWQAQWRPAIEAIGTCPFLLGAGGQGWKATFDWFLRPDSVTKILEGAYEQGKVVDAEQEKMHARVMAEAKRRERDGKS